MAEIPIQEKTHRRNIWPLIIGALLLLGLLAWCMRRGGDDAVPATGDTAGVVTPAPTDTALTTPATPGVTDTTKADTTKRP